MVKMHVMKALGSRWPPVHFSSMDIDTDVVHDYGKLEVLNKVPSLNGQNKAKRKNPEKGVKDTVCLSSAV